MNTLVVIGYDDIHRAEEMRLKLLKLQADYLIDLEDAVVAIRKPDGKLKLNQPVNLTAIGAAQGTFWGLLVGMLFLSPLVGAAIGASSGAVAGALTDIGIRDDFMKEMAKALKPGTSALFVLVRHVTPDKVLEQLQGTGGTLIKTSLTHADEEKLQAVLNEARKVAQPV